MQRVYGYCQMSNDEYGQDVQQYEDRQLIDDEHHLLILVARSMAHPQYQACPMR